MVIGVSKPLETLDNGPQSHFGHHVERKSETQTQTDMGALKRFGPKAPVHVRVPRPAEVVVDSLGDKNGWYGVGKL